MPDPSRFDDPILKAAVRRAWAGETAPPALRRRVQALLADERRVIRPSPSVWRQKLAALGMAAAAAIIVGVGIISLQRATPNQPIAAASLPTALGEQLVRSHDACTRLHPDDHHLLEAVPKDNFKAIAKEMAAELNHPVAAAPMGHDWDFRGAAVCPVGPAKAAHLLYRRGDAFVSVYSLPASAFPTCPNHENCDAALNGHPVAGFVEAGGFYCVVASSGGATPVDLQQVRAMRDQLRADVVAMHEQRALLASGQSVPYHPPHDRGP